MWWWQHMKITTTLNSLCLPSSGSLILSPLKYCISLVHLLSHSPNNKSTDFSPQKLHITSPITFSQWPYFIQRKETIWRLHLHACTAVSTHLPTSVPYNFNFFYSGWFASAFSSSQIFHLCTKSSLLSSTQGYQSRNAPVHLKLQSFSLPCLLDYFPLHMNMLLFLLP